MRTAHEFREKAMEKSITRWNIHECSMCGYPCGYVIEGDSVGYDSGCGCMWGGIQPSSWGGIADHYNRNAGAGDAQERYKRNPLFGEVVNEMNMFWGFENPEWLNA